jgi:outer membrane translocation and assembly module TamA
MRWWWLTVFFFAPVFGWAKTEQPLCGRFYVLKETLSFTQLFGKNDQLLICGSDVEGWQHVPQAQALYHIRVILNSQGYFSPSVRAEGEKLVIDPGPRSFVRKIIFKNDPEGFKDLIFRGIQDKPLTPAAITNVKDWSRSRLRAMGYPCPEVEVRAAYETETLEILLTPGPKLKLKKVIRPETAELLPQAFIRQDAFQIGDFFNADLLNLTSRRLITSDLAQFAHFEDRCTGSGAEATEKVILGKPRTLIFAVGASTEELPIFKTEWKNSRIDPFGSTLTGSFYASSRRQSLAGSAQLYWFPQIPELYVLPTVEVRRETEPTYKSLSEEFQFGLAHVNDDSHNRYTFQYLPTYTIEDTLEGEGPSHVNYFSFETRFQIMSHYFEYYQATPQEGYAFNGYWQAQRDGLGSPLSLDLLNFNGTYLINLGRFDPPLTVLGVRFGHSVLMTSDLAGTPASFRLFLGGADDVRGFSRKSINNANSGYQTTSYLGVEARFLEMLPWQLQPYVFIDGAKVGETAWTWEQSTYISPGVGVRWQSPVGSLRGSVAKGGILKKDLSKPQPKEEWNFYLSYGREF